MGTRSVHVFPNGNQYKWQYLQFDGYPRVQLKSIINAFKNTIIFSYNKEWNEKNKNIIIDFLNAFYELRSFTSEHSINANEVVNSYDLNVFSDRMCCEWAYEWYFEKNQLNLKITNLSSLEQKVISLIELINVSRMKDEQINEFIEKYELEEAI